MNQLANHSQGEGINDNVVSLKQIIAVCRVYFYRLLCFPLVMILVFFLVTIYSGYGRGVTTNEIKSQSPLLISPASVNQIYISDPNTNGLTLNQYIFADTDVFSDIWLNNGLIKQAIQLTGYGVVVNHVHSDALEHDQLSHDVHVDQLVLHDNEEAVNLEILILKHQQFELYENNKLILTGHLNQLIKAKDNAMIQSIQLSSSDLSPGDRYQLYRPNLSTLTASINASLSVQPYISKNKKDRNPQQLIQLTVTADKDSVVRFINTYAVLAVDHFNQVVSSRFDQKLNSIDQSNLRLVYVPAFIVSYSDQSVISFFNVKRLIIFFVAGLFLSLLLLIYYFIRQDARVKPLLCLEEMFLQPILSVFSYYQAKPTGSEYVPLPVKDDIDASISKQLRNLTSYCERPPSHHEGAYVISFPTAVKRSGGEFVSYNTAQVLVDMEHSVLLIEADHDPALDTSLSEHTIESLDGGVKRWVINTQHVDLSRTLLSNDFIDGFNRAKNDFDYIIINPPSIIDNPEVNRLLGYCHRNIMVLGLGCKPLAANQQALNTLNVNGIQVDGLIANFVTSNTYRYARYAGFIYT